MIGSSDLPGLAAGTGGGWQLNFVGTLLGPEGSNFWFDASSGRSFHQTASWWCAFVVCRLGVGGDVWVEHRPYLENCTVDASIFVAKL